MRCGCENSMCKHPHKEGSCEKAATVACEYVGGLCEPCAQEMIRSGGAQYIHRELYLPADYPELR